MKANQADFTRLAGYLLDRGHNLRFQATGSSMQPEILHGDMVTIAPVKQPLAEREIVLYLTPSGRPILHRIIRIHQGPIGQPLYLLRGDAQPAADGWLGPECILGRLVTVERCGQPGWLPGGQWIKTLHRIRRRIMNRVLG